MKEALIRWLYPRARFKIFMLAYNGAEYWMARSSKEAALVAGDFHKEELDYYRFIELSYLSMRNFKFVRHDGSLMTFEKRFQMLEKRPQLFALDE